MSREGLKSEETDAPPATLSTAVDGLLLFLLVHDSLKCGLQIIQINPFSSPEPFATSV